MILLFKFNAGLIELENDGVVALFVCPFVARPAYTHCAERLAQLDGEGLFGDLIGDKLRAGEEVEQNISENERGDGVYLAVVIRGRVCELTANDLGGVYSEPAHDEGVEALDTVVAGVSAQQGVGLFAQLYIAAAALSFSLWFASTVHTPKRLEELEARMALINSAQSRIEGRLELALEDLRQ